MLISDILFNIHVRAKVVHAIPGRMRVHIPIAKKIPEAWRMDAAHLDVFKRIHGVTGLEFNYLTSNALILYDPELTDEKHIIENMMVMAKLANTYRKKLSSFTADEKESAIKWFVHMLESEFVNIKGEAG